jgi:hypothetical protein
VRGGPASTASEPLKAWLDRRGLDGSAPVIITGSIDRIARLSRRAVPGHAGAVTLYFTESALRLSTTRTDAQLDLARADVLARVARMRAGEFVATPGDPCRYCDYARMCPEKRSLT